MITNKSKFILLLTFSIASLVGFSAEQDNWYIANEWTVTAGTGVAYYEDNNTGVGQIYICNGSSTSSKISVYDLNGSLARDIPIANTRYYAYDLALDSNGTIYIAERHAVTCLDNNGTFKWRTGKNASISHYGSNGSGDGEFYNAEGIDIGPNEKLYIADKNNRRVQILDKNGSFISKFGSYGSAPGQFYSPSDLVCMNNGNIVISDWDANYLHYFDENGTFIKRVNHSTPRYRVSQAKDGTLFSRSRLRNPEGELIEYIPQIADSVPTCFTPEGDLIVSVSNQLIIWKRAYRTKGLPTRNVIPQPSIRAVSQQSGTNIIDLDFEIVDPDDANATIGIIAAVNGAFNNPSSLIVPTAWVNGTGNKIGTPIATNQVHRVSWNVKGDWSQQTGTLNFELFCQDARRASQGPVDLHFLDLPLIDGNLSISRSPIKDSDIENFFKYQLSIGAPGISIQNNKFTDGNGTVYLETNMQATEAGRSIFVQSVGHRWAKIGELALAREASTSGSINQWTATRPIYPRNLPNKVNEYGFDTGSHGARAWWVVRSSTISIPNFTMQELDDNASANGHSFGSRVDINGSNLVVAKASGHRKVYHYNVSETNGSITANGLISPNSEANSMANEFGFSLAIDGNLLAVGAKDAYESGVPQVGAVYLFELNSSNSTQVARITASDGSSSDQFGYDVEVSGNLIVAGARDDDPAGKSNAGSAYVFRRESNGSITELAKLLHEDPQSSDHFGWQVAIFGNMVAVGAERDDVIFSGSNKQDAGSVTLFKLDGNGTATRTMTLTAPNPYNSCYFGSAVAMSGDMLAVGEYRRNTTNSYSGRVYLYKINPNGTAQLTTTIDSPNPRNYGYFGISVDLSGDRLAIGANEEYSDYNQKTGAAYLYKVKPNGSVILWESFRHTDGINDDKLGRSVSVSGRNFVAGAYLFDEPGKSNTGKVIHSHSSY